MTNEEKDVKEEVEAQPAPVQEQEEQQAEVSEDVKTPAEGVDRKVYEKVREDMKSEREAKRAALAETNQLKAEIEALKERQDAYSGVDTEKASDPLAAKVEILTLMQKDEFVKENLDLVEQAMVDNPGLTAQDAIKELKADYFDRIQKEGSTVEVNKPQSQKPTSTTEPPQETKPKAKDPSKVLQDVLDGKIEIDPEQLESIKRTLGK